MISIIRVGAAGLLGLAAAFGSHEGWAAGTVDRSGPVAASSAPVEAQGQSARPQNVQLPPPPGRGDAAAPRADLDADNISDALEARLAEAAPGEMFDVIVVFEGPGGLARSRAAVGAFPVIREFSVFEGFQASMTAAQIRGLSGTPGLFRIEENAEVTAFDIFSNDDTGATAARSTYGVTGAGVTICVLDTGINPNHEQIDSKALTSAEFADFVSGRADPYDDHWHGSHVAGIAAGDGQGGSNLADDAIGVAPDAYLKVGKVLNSSGSGTTTQIVDGIEWCAGITEPLNADVSVISMSLGGAPTDGSDALSLAVNCVADPGYRDTCGTPGGGPKIPVIAAGNSGAEPGTIGAPGVAANAITVGSFAEWSGDPAVIWQDDGVYLNPFSSRGPVEDGSGTPLWTKPDISAVGSRVLSAYVNDATNPSPTAYASASGTSMATPFVSGVVALMLDANPDLGVDDSASGGLLPHQKVRAILTGTAIDRGPVGQDNEYGAGLVDAFAAVAEALAASETETVLSYAPTDYPGYTQLSGSVADGKTWLHEFEVTSEDVGFPVAAMMTIDGQVECASFFFGSCLAFYWAPDLELVVEELSGGSWSQVTADTSGSAEVTRSECPATGECGQLGRVELVHFLADAAGSFRFRVYPSAGDPNNGAGGAFDFEISMGPPASFSGNEPPTASIGAPADGSSYTEEDIIDFTGSASDPEDGDLSESLAWASDLDGAIGNGSSVSTSALSVGVHTITATATDSGGRTGSDSITVSVTLPDGTIPPTADFSVSTSGLTASFTDTSTDPDGSIAAWDWDFGDGNVSSAQNPSHSYAGDGTYTVTLTVTDNDGVSDSVNKDVAVAANKPPVSSFSVDRDPCGSDWFRNECEFTDTSSDENGEVVDWNWDFGGGSVTGGIIGGPGHKLLVKFPSDGANPETVSLTVTDDDGATHSWSKQIWISHPDNAVPTASFDVATSGLTADFTDGSTDSDGTVTAWAWDFGDGATSTEQNPSHAYAAGGTYTVTLQVTDDGGSQSRPTSQDVTVSGSNEPPAVTITAPAGGGTFAAGESVAFAGAAEDPEDGDVSASLVWTSDIDGQIGTGGSFSASLTAGSHTVTATAEDANGATGDAQVSLTVEAANEPPVASISAPAEGTVVTEGDTVTFEGSASDLEDDDLTASLAWTSDLDGSLASGGSISVATLSVGTHLVTASVTDSDGETGSDTVSVTVEAASTTLIAHIGDLDDASLPANRGRWEARVAVLVLDDAGTPVTGATVAGTWENGASGSTSCPTDSTGWCEVSEPNVKNNVESVTFTVDGVSGSDLTYEGSLNADPDGDSTGTVITVVQPDTSGNTAPTASIDSPADSSSFDGVNPILFEGSAADAEDGNLSGSLAWISSIDGALGDGGSVSAALSDGSHTITASVTDSGGLEDSATISITVGSAPSEGFALTATGYKVQGVHTIDLSWSPSDKTGKVDVLRDGSVEETVDDDGFHPHSTGNKGGGSYDMQVCETESDGLCSNMVPVVF